MADGTRLRADCASCFGLCCVVPAFAASSDFAIDKPAGQACPNLRDAFRCGIHSTLRRRGFPGCTAYDCFGAGQQVSQVTFGGRDWRAAPATRAGMFAAFPVMRTLHELLWYLTAALALPEAAALHDELRQARDDIERRTRDTPAALLAQDVDAHRDRVATLLRQVSALVRGTGPTKLRTKNLVGADLRRADLRRADLRGASLLGADLTGADLTGTDLIGADLRGADLTGADLQGALFLTQFQLNAANGDSRTALPPDLTRPAHWPPARTVQHRSRRVRPDQEVRLMSIERGSDKHGPRLDDELADEVRGTLSSGRETHSDEFLQAEPSGEDEPAVDQFPADIPHGGLPDGLSDSDVEERSELAGWLHRGLFPAVREVLLDEVVDQNAPEHVVDEVRRLPAGREFTSLGDVWRTLNGGGHVEEHRF